MRASRIIVVFVFLITALAAPAHAYLDPGSGSMLVQLLLGGLAGVALFFKLFWHGLLGRLGIRRGAADQPLDSDPSRAPHSRPTDG